MSASDPNAQRMARALQAIDRLQGRLAEAEAATVRQREAIAVIGVGCRFPGADDVDAFWTLLDEGVDAISEVPADRWDAEAYHDADPDAPGTIVTRNGGFIAAPDAFDAAFFGISPREAASLDPQQRLLLEVAWETMEHAGLPPPSLAGQPVGVFVGASSHDYSQMLLSRPEQLIDAYLATGNSHSVAAGRLSYQFGFTGPSLAVDTACSSSLVAVHLACQALRAGECDMALAGGVNRILTPDGSIVFSRAHMLAPDGRCKTFDAAADGFTRAEGCGLVMLKRLSDAQRDGDRILALVRGSAVNQDGRSGGLTVPNGPSQQAVIRRALEQAGLAPRDIDYVEAHGTGTALGDPIEIGALAAVFAATRERPLAVGSVKTNVGHLEAAAGICGLIKLVLSLQHERLPRQLHFTTPNPLIDWAHSGVEVLARPRPWTGGEARHAGVSSFGFGGTNAHVVLSAAPAVEPPADEDGADVLLLSARDEAALRALAGRWANHLASSRHGLRTLARAALAQRAAFAHRLALPAKDRADARQALQHWLAGGEGHHSPVRVGEARQAPRIAFLYTGQGAQYAGMARALYAAEPAFRDTMDRCDALFRADGGRSLIDLACRDDVAAELDMTASAQPALYAVECALAALWRAWGVQPVAVLGHSIGEFAAAVTAGVFDLETGMRLVIERGRLMQALPEGGAMAALALPADAVLPHLQAGLTIAALNGPEACVVSGPAHAVDALCATLQADGVQVRRLAVSHAFHSPAMVPAADGFARFAAGLPGAAPRLPMYSTLSGRRVETAAGDWSAFWADYWARQMVQPVRFDAALGALLEQGVDLLIEIGPQPHLCALAQPRLAGRPALPSLRRGQDGCLTMAESVAALHCAGARLTPPTTVPRIDLPRQPFQRRRHWFEASSAPRLPRAAAQHPLLGAPLDLADADRRHFQAEFDASLSDWAGEHLVYGGVVLPAAGFVDCALALAQATGRALHLRDIEFSQALRLDRPRTLQVSASHDGQGGQRFRIHARGADAAGEGWMLHAEGRLAEPSSSAPAPTLDEARAQCVQPVEVEAVYRRLAAQQIEYGPSFHALRALQVDAAGDAAGRALLARIELPAAVRSGAHLLHPVLLDACLQGIAAFFVDELDHPTYLPAAMGEVRLSAACPRALWCHLRARRQGGQLNADIDLFDDAGRPFAQVRALQLRPASAPRVLDGVQEDAGPWVVDWIEAPLLPAPALPAPAALTPALRAQAAAELASDDCRRQIALLPELDALAARWARRVLADVGEDAAARGGIVEALRPLHARLQVLAADLAVADDSAALEADRARLAAAHPQAAAELALFGRCARGMADALRGRVDALSLLFPGGDASDLARLYGESPGARLMNLLVRDALARALQHAKRPLRIVEIGAGTGGTTRHLLPVLAPDAGHDYLYTDIAPSLLAQARSQFDHPALRFERLDIEQPPPAALRGQADIVVAANVLHATRDIGATLAHVAQLLAPGGWLLLPEVTQPLGWLDMIFGLTEGWWRFSDRALRGEHALLPATRWCDALRAQGFDDACFLLDEAAGLPNNIMLARRGADLPSPHVIAVGAPLPAADGRPWLLDLRGAPQQAHEDPDQDRDQGPDQAPEGIAAAVDALRDAIAALAPAPASSLTVLTRAACAVEGEGSLPRPAQAALWGVLRVAQLEHPDLLLRRVDLDVDLPVNALPAEAMADVLHGVDRSVAWRRGRRLKPRLGRLPAAQGGPVELHLARRGSPDDLALRPLARRAPAAHEVEIRVSAAGLNLIDVLDTLGLLPFERGWLGVECAGEVVACGEAVRDVAPGDAVYGLAPGAFRSFVTVDARWVARRPRHLSAAGAAALPAAFLTAWHALVETARLQPGETVLIHSAAGGTGLAAVTVARMLGAHVLATASPGKWPLLRARGVDATMHSRTLDFADAVKRRGGVDVVLNALSGDFITASLDCLKPGGRFVEIGKRDILSPDQARALRPDVGYSVVDVLALARDEPARMRALLDTLTAAFDEGRLQPLPFRVHALARAADAFRCMQRAQHVGKLVLDIDAETAQVRADASYLVTGGCGGLGLRTAQWLVAQGARHLVLLGRSAPSAEAAQALEGLRAEGCELRVRQIDVSDGAALQALFAGELATLPPLRGIFHAAGVLADALLADLDAARLHAVLAPKALGAWHLHRLSRDLPLDHFALYSSAAALFGSPGQAAHVAANSYLDALAHRRRALGLAAQAINWGPWSDIGSAASVRTQASMQARGIASLTPEQGMRAFAALSARRQLAQAGVVALRWADFANDAVRGDDFFAAFRTRMERAEEAAPAGAERAAWDRIAALSPALRRAELVRLLQDEVAAVLGLPSGQRPDPATGFFDMGMDSLMAVELRNRLSRRCGVALSPAGIFEFPTIQALAGHLLEALLPEPVAATPPAAATPDSIDPAMNAVPDSIDPAREPSPDSIDPAIAAELAALDALLNKT
ncbi:MAG: SDR family NAD(P)-dependent oxidoreductase [Methyloversatilis sp.]|jgi:acyl transferase domain-containing protein/NADPH:quinone reductase-like Zn-dependent oxidoreductase/SAM-dependent methyltransferase/acyl carrier protein|nr:SDR family NAD(P)-dependent oxidoreductase [Methyloversatilis sp.]